MPTLRLVVDWTAVKFRLQIHEAAKTTEERYLPDDIVQRIIDFKTLKDIAVERDRLLRECCVQQRRVNEVWYKNDVESMRVFSDACGREHTASRLYDAAVAAYEVALLKVA